MGVYGKGLWVWAFYMGQCVLREWVVRGGGSDGYFGEQGVSAGSSFQNGTARIVKANW